MNRRMASTDIQLQREKALATLITLAFIVGAVCGAVTVLGLQSITGGV